MIKKLFIVYVISCFLALSCPAQGGTDRSPVNTKAGPRTTAERILHYKQTYHSAAVLFLTSCANRTGSIDLSEGQRHLLRHAASLHVADCLDELGREEYIPFFALMPGMSLDCFKHAADRISSEAGIGTETIIGLPLGVPVYVFSWIVYFAAKYFEDSNPTLGLFLYTVSVLLEMFGMYIIL